MQTLVRVQILCRVSELLTYEAFHRAAEFGSYDSDIDIVCTETRQTKTYICTSVRANCYGWRFFKEEWERQFGRIHP
jgi:hypothetical protein